MRAITTAVAGTMAAMLLAGGSVAYGQTKAAPEKAQGAGAECARTTAPGQRDECVHQQKNGSSSTIDNRSTSGTSGSNSTSGGANSSTSGQSNTSIGSGNNTSIGTHNTTSGSQTQSNTSSGTQSNTSTSGTSGASGSMDRDRGKPNR